jgi:hypothetical protein
MTCKNVASAIEQCFLLYRYYGLSRSIFWTTIVFLLILAHLGSGFTLIFDLFIHHQFGRPIVNLTIAISFSLNAAIDIILPVLLTWELRKITAIYSSTQSLIRRIIVNAASSGCCVSLAEVFLLVLVWTQPEVELLGCVLLAPFYGMTVLINLFVCQSSRATVSPTTKTGNVTTLDSVRLQMAFHPDHTMESKDGSGTDGNMTSSS